MQQFVELDMKLSKAFFAKEHISGRGRHFKTRTDLNSTYLFALPLFGYKAQRTTDLKISNG